MRLPIPYLAAAGRCSRAERRDINGKTHIVTLPDALFWELDEKAGGAGDDAGCELEHKGMRLRCIIARRRRTRARRYCWRRGLSNGLPHPRIAVG